MNNIVHITSGDSAGGSLTKAGLPGEVFVWHDILYDGPRNPGWPDEDTLNARARFLERTTAGGLDRQRVLETLRNQYHKLEATVPNQHIVLWFDACLFDQSMLAHVLTCLHHKGIREVELLCVDAFPGIEPFHGLGQLQPEQLAALYDNRRPVTDEQFRFAVVVDEAFATQDAALLAELSEATDAPLPWVPAAVTRWREEQPDPGTGLGRLEGLALAAIRAGCATPGKVFAFVAAADTPPQFWGDTTLWAKINGLAGRVPPLVQIEGPTNRLPQWESDISLKEFTIMQSDTSKPRERIIAALERQPLTGRVPHFELIFFPTMEAFGKVHPCHRDYGQWDQMEARERQMHREDMADVYIATAERYGHSAIVIRPNPNTVEEIIRMIDIIRDKTGDQYFIMCPRDATYAIPNGNWMVEFSQRIADDMEGLKAEAEARVDKVLDEAEEFANHGGLDGFDVNADYCFNTGPFLSPDLFSELVTPYLARLMQGFRDLGLYAIKHTDGNIMPILDQLVEARPHALHSLDPQAGVDIAEVKQRCGDRICLMGNVNCGLLDTGTEDEVIESARYALRHGMPGGGYIFSTSNCIYTGMRLSRYELMLDVWRREGIYGPA